MKSQIEEEKRTKDTLLAEQESKTKCLQNDLDLIRLEFKQQQQSIQQEKILQLKELKQEQMEIDRLKNENTELKNKLDEKLGEIKNLGNFLNI